jgi:dihydroorotase
MSKPQNVDILKKHELGRIKLYDLIVKNGLVVDPASGTNEEMDLAVTKGRVAAVEAKIPDNHASRVIDASGMIVTPGLIDIHAHVALELVRLSVDAEASCLLKGSTTVVDAGSIGELSYKAFNRFIMATSRARILAFLNIESLGMVEWVDSPPSYSDQKWAELLTASDEVYASHFINVDNTVKVIQSNRDTIVGIKWAHHGLKSLAMARAAANKAGCILMIEKHHVPESLKYVTKGDIVTHIYLPVAGRGKTNSEEVFPELIDAKKRGVLFDVGHGKESFSWKVAELAIKENLKPDTISTDLWAGNLNGPVFDLPTTMAKFLHLGMTLEEVVNATTATPANLIGKVGIGSLKLGACADISIFRLQEGRFPLTDCYGERRMATRMFVPIHVIRDGRIIF